MALRRSPNKEYEDLKELAAKARLPYDKDAWLNVAFYLDEQYVEWKDDLANVRTIPRETTAPNAPRPVINKIMHFVNADQSFVMQNEPQAQVIPATDNILDVGDANVATAYLDHLQSPAQMNFTRVLSDAVLWSLVANQAYLKWIYNPRVKRPDVMFCPSVDVYADPFARDFSKCRYLVHSQFMDPEQVHDLYGVEVKPNKVERADMVKTQLLREMGQAPVISGVTVNELWHLPSRKYPNGLYVVWAGHQVLVEPRDFPYDHGRLPFTLVGAIPRPNTYHYSSPTKYLRSAQMELNKYHAQRLVVRETFANPKWFLPSELELEEEPDDSPNQKLKGHSQGGAIKPEIIQPATFPDQTDGDWLVQEMQNIVGIHEVSQGQVPGRVEAAQAIELLREADASRLSELNKSIRGAVSEGFYQVLLLAKQYVPEKVIVQTYSPEGVPEVRHFRAGLVQDNMRVRVTQGTGLAHTRAARHDQVMRMVELGLIQQPEVAVSLLEIPIPTVLTHRVADIRKARNENLEMARDVAVTPNSWDDHDIHIREHDTYRKTAEFMGLPADVQSKFEFHVQKHKELRVQKLVEMSQEQVLMAQATQPPPAPTDAPAGAEPSPTGQEGVSETAPPAAADSQPAGAPVQVQPQVEPVPIPIQLDVQLQQPERGPRTIRVEEPGKPVRRLVEE